MSALAGVRRRVARGSGVGAAIAAEESAASASALVAAMDSARRDVEGAGDAVQRLLEEPEVTDVVIHAGRVWVDRGDGMAACEIDLGGEREVRALAVRLAALAGVRLDDSSPIVDGVLPSGVRLHAVVPPVAADGTSISLRPLHPGDFTLAELVRLGMCDEATADVLGGLVRGRANAVIAGATGTGKTTLLAALLARAGAHERIVCIEEAAELRPNHQHVVHLQQRAANVQGRGEVPLAELVRAAMRMRPDRIVLGEARGIEVRQILTALNTGHGGSWFTVHANSAQDVPARLAALSGLTPPELALQADAALDAIVFVRRVGAMRWVSEIAAIEGARDLTCVPVLVRPHPREPSTGSEAAMERWQLSSP